MPSGPNVTMTWGHVLEQGHQLGRTLGHGDPGELAVAVVEPVVLVHTDLRQARPELALTHRTEPFGWPARRVVGAALPPGRGHDDDATAVVADP